MRVGDSYIFPGEAASLGEAPPASYVRELLRCKPYFVPWGAMAVVIVEHGGTLQ